MMKFVQLNTNRSRVVYDLLWKDSIDCDVLVLSEPNKKLCLEKNYICDFNLDTAVRIITDCDNNSVIDVYRSRGFVCVEFSVCVVVSSYVSPNVDMACLEGVLFDMQQHVRRDKPTIIAGNLNAKSALWGSPVEDGRGRLVADWLAQNGLVVANVGSVPTFVRRNSSSFLDVTFCTIKAADKISNWRVHTSENMSDHRTITFEYGGG